MSKKQILIISSILVLPFNFFIFKISSAIFDTGNGFLLGFISYWIYASLFALFLVKDNLVQIKNLFQASCELKYARLFKAAAFLPAVAAFFLSFLPNFEKLTLRAGLIIMVISVVNATIEEIYWRGLYLKEYFENRRAGLIVSSLPFALMHVSFYGVDGMIFFGGFFALVGGAFLMGLLWSYLSFKLNNIRYCIAGHILVNTFAFTGLFIENDLKFA